MDGAETEGVPAEWDREGPGWPWERRKADEWSRGQGNTGRASWQVRGASGRGWVPGSHATERPGLKGLWSLWGAEEEGGGGETHGAGQQKMARESGDG